MNNKTYNILWIDDEYQRQDALIRSARDNNIKLIPFKSLDGGISELTKNYPYFDGILLDAKFFENEDDVAESEDIEFSFRAKERIEQLPKKFEIFVLTGQAEAFEDKTYKKVFKNVFKKGIDEDEDALFEAIIKAADNQIDTQIRHKYQRVFDVCTEKYIGELAGKDLLNLLKDNGELDSENYFNSIRKVIEDLIKAFYKFNLLPKDFIYPSISLNESSKFLTGKNTNDELFKEKGYQHNIETHLPKQISNSLRNILSITQAGSHRSEIDQHVKLLNTPYLLQSILFQLLDILIWFKIYIDGKPKTENWIKIDSSTEIDLKDSSLLCSGTVININYLKGFAFFKPFNDSENVFIPPHLVNNHSLVENQTIDVEIEEYTDNRTGENKSRVKRINQ
ncbi:MAG: hypothetical protein VB011_02625 [Bacteroidales bacterium]|nr:hypothetical protein [Bacteroidales bacterium]